MSIFPLPQFEADLEADRATYEALKPPTTIVVRFGAMRMVGEFPYSGDSKPGCGSKIVVRSVRGVEIGEMLTSTCPNAGCSKSVTRQEMLDYVEASGGADYPFFTDGRALRVATVEDIQRQSALDATRPQLVRSARAVVAELDLPMKMVEAEPILGGEVLTFYFTSEQRVDFRELVRRLAEEHRTRIELRQVGARDEARLTADYERCGQHCCCKQFLKVLKPVSMRSAKVQKSTLDPLKISGRCGRLMCCLRYEDETYETLRKRLPHKGTRVGTPEGPGTVVDSQILTQLVLVQLERAPRQVAVPVEQLGDPDATPPPAPPPPEDPFRGMPSRRIERRAAGPAPASNPPPGAPPGPGPAAATPSSRAEPPRRERTKQEQQDAYRERAQRERGLRPGAPEQPSAGPGRPDGRPRREGRPRPPRPQPGADAGPPPAPPGPNPDGPAPQPGGGKKRRRRRSGGRGRGDASPGGDPPAGPGGGPS